MVEIWKDPTDVTHRKPRQLRGTPARKFSLIYAFTTLVICSGIGCIEYFGSLGQKVSQNIQSGMYDFTLEDKKRKFLMGSGFFLGTKMITDSIDENDIND